MICLAGAYPNMKIYQPGVRANETQHALTGKELRVCILLHCYCLKYYFHEINNQLYFIEGFSISKSQKITL